MHLKSIITGHAILKGLADLSKIEHFDCKDFIRDAFFRLTSMRCHLLLHSPNCWGNTKQWVQANKVCRHALISHLSNDVFIFIINIRIQKTYGTPNKRNTRLKILASRSSWLATIVNGRWTTIKTIRAKSMSIKSYSKKSWSKNSSYFASKFYNRYPDRKASKPLEGQTRTQA